MSPSEVHACVKRAQASHLLHDTSLHHLPNVAAIEEFLVHGLKYAFPAEHGEPTRGVATSYAAEPLRGLIAPAVVTRFRFGPMRKVGNGASAFAPLYRTAADRRPCGTRLSYEYLVLADALRDGRLRERKFAEAELHRRLGLLHA